jgi:hypothetical protein
LLGPWLVACALLLGGCEEPKLPKSWRVSYARVLGVRAEVIGDETRATPEPSERVRVRVLIVGDEPIEYLSYDLIACPAAPARGELASCAAEPFFSERSELEGSIGLARELIVELDVPEQDALDGAERVLIGGTICTDGSARSVEGGEGRCQGGSAHPVTFIAHVVLALDEADINRNPVLADDAIRFDDDIWPSHAAFDSPSDDDAGADREEADAGASLSIAADGKQHTIAISLEASGRETRAEGAEELQLSHFVTAGVLERRFSVLEREQNGREPFLVKWHMPRLDAPPAQLLAVFVLRDQHGGVAYALRTLDIGD